MASYEDIRTYFEGSDLLREAVRKTSSIPIVTGFTLDIDPLWSHLYDVENNLVDLAQAPLWVSDPRYFRHLAISGGFPLLPPDRGFRRRDLNKDAPQWKNEVQAFRTNAGLERLPVILTVVHRPLRAASSGQVLNDDTSLLQQLIQASHQAGVLVRIEERPHARFAFAAGDRIAVTPAISGTLGGILDDRAGVSYGVTCSHVARKNDTIYDATGDQIGNCTADTRRVSLANAQICDPIALAAPDPIPGNGPDVNMLDCALIKLSSVVARPTIAGVAQALSPGQSVVLTGAVTRTTRHWLGSLCLSYVFSGGGQNFCFRDSIELIPQPRGLFCRARVPTQGDSGGWVLTDDQPPEWAGVFFGEDGKRGFAVRAKWVHEWAQRVTETTLTANHC